MSVCALNRLFALCCLQTHAVYWPTGLGGIALDSFCVYLVRILTEIPVVVSGMSYDFSLSLRLNAGVVRRLRHERLPPLGRSSNRRPFGAGTDTAVK